MASASRSQKDRRTAQAPIASPPPIAGDRGIHWQQIILKAAVIILATLWVYSPAYHGDWLWDDDQLLTANQAVQSPDGLQKLWFSPDTADYFPLTLTALWVQWRLWGMNQTGYHVVNVLFHALGGLLVWLLLRRMKLPGAWLGGLIFAIHPICAESVGWVSELKNTISLPLFLLSAYFYVRFDDEEKHSFYALSLLCFLASMLAKSAVVMLPVVILLYIWWKREEITRRDVIRTIPFFLVSLILGIVTIYFQHGRAIGVETILVGGFFSRLATAGISILFYLWKSAWPFELLPIYPRWKVDPPTAIQFLPWPIIIGTLAWFWSKRATWGRDALFTAGFFLLNLAPVLGFITMSYMRITWVSDHFVYLPLVGLVGAASTAAARLYETTEDSLRPMMLGAATLILCGLGLMTYRYAGIYQNEDALWNYTLKYNPDAWQAHNRLGAKLFQRGDIDGGFYHFTQSTRLRPDLGETHNNLGTALAAKGRLDEAIAQFTEAYHLTPHILATEANLANALVGAGRFQEASDHYANLIKKEPRNASFYSNYGVTLFRCGRNEEAIVNFRKALELNPNLKDAKENLAIALGSIPQLPPPPPGGGLLDNPVKLQLK